MELTDREIEKRIVMDRMNRVRENIEWAAKEAGYIPEELIREFDEVLKDLPTTTDKCISYWRALKAISGNRPLEVEEKKHTENCICCLGLLYWAEKI